MTPVIVCATLALLVFLPLLVSSQPLGDSFCKGSSVCSTLADNVEAILDARRSLGCCSHDACVPFPDGTTKCSVGLATSLQPCMLKDYVGSKSGCIKEMVGEVVPAVCGNMWLKCDAMESLVKYLQLAQAVSGCPTSGGAISFSAVFESIVAPIGRRLFALVDQGLDTAAAVKTPLLDHATLKLSPLSSLVSQGLDTAAAVKTPLLNHAAAKVPPLSALVHQGFDTAAAVKMPLLDHATDKLSPLSSLVQQGLDTAAAAKTPLLNHATVKLSPLSSLIQQGFDTAAAVSTPILNHAAAKLPPPPSIPEVSDRDPFIPSEDVDVPAIDVDVPAADVPAAD